MINRQYYIPYEGKEGGEEYVYTILWIVSVIKIACLVFNVTYKL